MAALAKPGTETEEESETGKSAEYMRSPIKVSQISRAISMVYVVVVVVPDYRRRIWGIGGGEKTEKEGR